MQGIVGSITPVSCCRAAKIPRIEKLVKFVDSFDGRIMTKPAVFATEHSDSKFPKVTALVVVLGDPSEAVFLCHRVTNPFDAIARIQDAGRSTPVVRIGVSVVVSSAGSVSGRSAC